MPDELTGLADLAELHRTLEREFERRGPSQGSVALVLLQLAYLEPGDTGFERGRADAVLIGVAGVLRYLTGASSEVARWEGDRFGVVLPATDNAGAAMLAERVRAELEEMPIPAGDRGGEVRVRAYFGVASAPANARDAEGLFSAAEEALRRARGRGH